MWSRAIGWSEKGGVESQKSTTAHALERTLGATGGKVGAGRGSVCEMQNQPREKEKNIGSIFFVPP